MENDSLLYLYQLTKIFASIPSSSVSIETTALSVCISHSRSPATTVSPSKMQ